MLLGTAASTRVNGGFLREREPQIGEWWWWWRNHAPYDVKMFFVVLLIGGLIAAVAITRGGEASGSADSLVSRPSGSLRTTEDFDATLRSESSLYDRWKRLNPVEAAAFEEYVDALRAGSTARPPTLFTPFGRALVAAASEPVHGRAAPLRDQ